MKVWDATHTLFFYQPSTLNDKFGTIALAITFSFALVRLLFLVRFDVSFGLFQKLANKRPAS